MTDKLKVAFIGVGGMGQCAHLKNFIELADQCEVIALAELRENTGRKVAERYGIPKYYSTAAELLASEKPDALVASQPFNRHGIILDELIPANLPIFIEKPLAASMQVAEEILTKLAKSKSKIMVGYHKRSDLATEYAKKVINELKASGELGPMKYIRILMPAGDWIAAGFGGLIQEEENDLPDFSYDPAPLDMDKATFDEYSEFVNYYIHQVNLMRHLLGEDYGVTYADPGKVLLVGTSESGVTCSIEMSPYVTTIDWQESALVCFERGYVKIGLPAPLASNRPGTVEILKDPGFESTPETMVPDLPWTHAMKNQALNFINFAQGKAQAPCDAEEALKDLKLAKDYIGLLKN